MLKVFLAGASSEFERVAHAALLLEASGLIELPDRWWELAADGGFNDRADHENGRAVKLARDHLRAIRKCHVFWLLFPEKRSYGAFVELGAAIGMPVVVTGQYAKDTIYTAAASFVSPDDRMGAVEVFRLAREREQHPLAMVP